MTGKAMRESEAEEATIMHTLCLVGTYVGFAIGVPNRVRYLAHDYRS